MWESFLRDAPHDFYHLPAYVELCAGQEGGDPAGLYVESADGAMLVPLIIRRIQGGGHDAVSPYGYPGPITNGVGGHPFIARALLSGMETLEAQGIVACFRRLHPLLNRVPPRGLGLVVEHGDNVSIDLTLPPEDLWRQTRRDHRRRYQAIPQAPATARTSTTTMIHFDTFKRLYRSTMERVSASPFYFFDDTFFNGLRSALGDRLHLCVVEIDGEIAARCPVRGDRGDRAVPPLGDRRIIRPAPTDQGDAPLRSRLGEGTWESGPVPGRRCWGRQRLAPGVQVRVLPAPASVLYPAGRGQGGRVHSDSSRREMRRWIRNAWTASSPCIANPDSVAATGVGGQVRKASSRICGTHA